MVPEIYSSSIEKFSMFGYEIKNINKKTFHSGIDKDEINLDIVSTTPEIKLNSLNFRSDEFLTTHNGKHFLFAGCSNTFGYGLKKEEMWSSKFISLVEESGEVVSGNFNISVPGISVFEIVTNAMKYCYNYGNPEVIFIQLQNTARFYGLNPDDGLFRHSIINESKDSSVLAMSKILEIYAYQYLLMLELFCKSNGIKLFIFSWDDRGFFSEVPELDNFYCVEPENLVEAISIYIDNNPKDKYAITARDKKHPGTATQEYWANLAFSLYNSR